MVLVDAPRKQLLTKKVNKQTHMILLYLYYNEVFMS